MTTADQATIQSAPNIYELTFQYVNDKLVLKTDLTLKECAMVFNSGMLNGKPLEWAEIWDGVDTDSLRFSFADYKSAKPAFKAITEST